MGEFDKRKNVSDCRFGGGSDGFFPAFSHFLGGVWGGKPERSKSDSRKTFAKLRKQNLFFFIPPIFIYATVYFFLLVVGIFSFVTMWKFYRRTNKSS